jgi:hypothetical protein
MNMKLWTQVVILLAMGLFTGSLAAQKNQKEPIRVFIFTAANRTSAVSRIKSFVSMWA